MHCVKLGGRQSPLELMHEAVASLRTLGKRSVLALVGIAIGSSSVIAMLNVGSNATEDASKIFKDMGVQTLVARLSEKSGITMAPPLSLEMEHVHQSVPHLLNVAPTAQMSGSISFNGRSVHADLVGATPELTSAMDLSLREGRFFSEFDRGETYAVVGHTLAEELATAGVEVRIGDHLRVSDYLFQVIGILQEHPTSMLIPVNANDSLFVPLAGMRRIDGSARIGSVVAKVAPDQPMNTVALALTGALERLMPDSEVTMVVPQQLIDGVSRQSRTFSYLLAALGGISLVGGGVGVMNVMLMNVSQRRREIGIRMALGARRRDIRNLFMMEAIALAAVGALCGAILGVLIALLYARTSGWSFSLAPAAIWLGAGSTLLVGLFSGVYPAVLASRLQPVEALRDE